MASLWQISWSTKKLFTFVLWSPLNWITAPASSSFCTAPLHEKFFLKALHMRFTSKSSARPATVVIHLRPLRCCTRTCTLSAVAFAPSAASSNASVEWTFVVIVYAFVQPNMWHFLERIGYDTRIKKKHCKVYVVNLYWGSCMKRRFKIV